MRRSAINEGERQSLTVGTDSEGGYLVPDEFERILIETLEKENIMRTLAKIIKTSSGDRKIPVVASKGSATWVDEEGPIIESGGTFTQVTIGAKEEEAFFVGDGEGKPAGIFNDTHGGGVGATTAVTNTLKADEILDLFYSLKSPCRKKATFITNDATVKEIRKLKDGNGQYLWQSSITAGDPDTLLNRPVKNLRLCPYY